MRTLWLVVVTLLVLAGCREEVSREPIGETQTVTLERSCTKPGYCFTCMPGFDGKMNCGLKFSPFCSGTQMATEKRTPMRITYDNGEFEDYIAVQTVAAEPCT